MLAAYRELERNKDDTIGIAGHLEQCAECRGFLALQKSVGEQVRLLPTLAPAPDAHTKLMQALAAEHARFLQRSSTAHASSASSVPDFLKPYMKEQVPARASETLKAFSTAETGPLPVLPLRRKKRVAPMGQFAVLGLAASFLMVLLIGGLVSMLFLANHGGTSPTVAISLPSLVAPVNYIATTQYPHVASAVATREHIYYSAYGENDTEWMVEQVNGTTKDTTSTPLLATSNKNPLFVLGASQHWVVWLQFDTPHKKAQPSFNVNSDAFTRTWSLNALSLAEPHSALSPFSTPIVLQHGVFDTTTVPNWVHTPIQGLWFVQQTTLLVASIDTKGKSQLVRYQLDGKQSTTVTPIMQATKGHILTSPTATADGLKIFWSELWFTDGKPQGQPHSTIWTQETTQETTRQHGAWRPGIAVNIHLFRSDETLFHPQVVNNTLFLLNTAGDVSTTVQDTPTPTDTATAQVTKVVQATPKPVSITPVLPRSTANYPAQVDESIHGTLLAFALDESATAQPTTISNNNTAAAPQAGMGFLVWQSSAGYQMYDPVAKSPVEVKNSTKGATFLAVNADTAVWVGSESTAASDTTSAQTATFGMFDWPTA